MEMVPIWQGDQTGDDTILWDSPFYYAITFIPHAFNILTD